MKSSKYNILFIAVILLFACQKDKIAIRDYHRVDISNDVSQDENGVTFNANIISEGNSPLIEKGFCWSSVEVPSIELSHISIFDDLSIGPFEATATVDFIPNTLYRVCAFVKTKETIVYSKEIEFSCNFTSHAPVLIDFLPKEAAWGDTVTISGENLSFISSNSKVSFGQTKASIISFSDTQLKVLVPELSSLTEVELSVTIIGKSKSFNDKFKFIQPEVLDFFPKDLSNNDTLTIIGKDFHPNSAYCNVIIEGLGCIIISNSSTEIKAIITIGNNDPEVSIIDTFEIAVFSGGKTLKPNDRLNFQYLSRWTKKNNFPGKYRKFALGFSYNGKGYYGLGAHPNSSIQEYYTDLWEYDPIEDKWTQKSPFPSLGRTKATYFQIDNYFFVCFGSSVSQEYNKEIWRYDASNDVWSKMNDFSIYNNRNIALGFSCGGKGYITGGQSGDWHYDVWEYDAGSDSWSKLNTAIPNVYFQGDYIAFGIGNDGYILGRGIIDRFTPENGTWKRFSNCPAYNMAATGFIIDKILYYGTGLTSSSTPGFMIYNPSDGSYSTINQVGSTRRDASSFAINGKGYLIG